MGIKIIISEDGSHTLFVPGLNETYHSHKGALRESQYVFIEQGLEYAVKDKRELTVFEVGFGTGLNALLTFMWAEEKKVKVIYYTLEPFPLDEEIVSKLNYLDMLHRNDLKDTFKFMHKAEWSSKIEVGNYFTFIKYKEKLEEFNYAILVDLVYYDAFAPNKQPEIWSMDNFEKMASLLPQGGILVSYCASGQFKRNLRSAGFVVETLSGPPGKKEMTRGVLV